MRAHSALALLCLLSSEVAHAQVVERHRFQGGQVEALGEEDNASPKSPDIFPQASLAFSNAAPRVTLHAFKFYLAVSDHAELPLYIATTLDAVSDTSAKNTETSILDESGGIVNVALGYSRKVTPFGLFAFANPEHGLIWDSRLGGKLVEAPGAGISISRAVPFLQAHTNLTLVLPIFSDAGATQRAGDLTIGFSAVGAASQAEDYRDAFVTQPHKALAFANLSAALNLTNLIYVSGGGTAISSDPAIKRRWYFGVSMLRK